MGAAYSYDLRVKVMKFLEEKNTVKAASVIFGISRKTIIEWKKIKKATGDVKAKEGYQIGHRQIIKDITGFKELVESNKDKSTTELAAIWPQKVSRWAVAKLLKKLGYTYKKNLHSSQKGQWRKRGVY